MTVTLRFGAVWPVLSGKGKKFYLDKDLHQKEYGWQAIRS